MDPINRLKAWKENISREDVIHWFTDKDHFKVGLDQGGSVIQIMNDLGFKNPHKDPMVELLGKMHMRSLINAARDYFERSGFIMSSRKFTRATPTVYFLIDNLSEERTERHLKLKVRAERATFKFHTDKIDILALIDKVKDPQTREKFKTAYSTKLNINYALVKKELTKYVASEKQKVLLEA